MARSPAHPESLSLRWARRSVSVPAMVLLVALGLALSPLLLVGALAVDVVRRRRFIALRFVVALACNLIMHLLGLLALLGSWLLGFRYLGAAAERQERLDFAVQCWWTRWTWRAAAYTYDMQLSLEGLEHTERGPYVLLSRHTSLLDTILPLVVISGQSGVRLRYVMKHQLLWDPCIDLIGHRFPTAFVRRGTQEHGPEIAHVTALLDGLTGRDAIVLYPEGTRFTLAKQARILASLRRKRPEVAAWAEGLRHVLPPHPGGCLALFERGAHDVVFCAHTGMDGAGHFADMVAGSLLGVTVKAQFWRVPASEVPKEPRAQILWLQAWWKRIDAWVDENRAASEVATSDSTHPEPGR